MRRARFLAPGWEAGQRSGVYHCISRVVDRRFVLKRAERERFVQLMRLYASFCGVKVLSYCVMSNHFHLLVEVPVRPEGGMSDGDLLARLGLLYGSGEVEEVRRRLAQCREAGDEAGAETVRERYFYRMWDLSQFMKTLKQRFTQWFNKRHERRGTLWEDRFKSVIVEDGLASRVIAAYIDLNPVRAGMVKDPGEYRWCSYAAAVAGRGEAREGLGRVMARWEGHRHGEGAPEKPAAEKPVGARGGRSGAGSGWRETVARYRVILFRDGQEKVRREEGSGEARVVRRGVRTGQREAVERAGGEMSVQELVRHRVRYFADGGVIGSREFLEEVFERRRGRFGPKRPSGARRIRGTRLSLFTLRDLRVDGIT